MTLNVPPPVWRCVRCGEEGAPEIDVLGGYKHGKCPTHGAVVLFFGTQVDWTHYDEQAKEQKAQLAKFGKAGKRKR